ncbi:Peroxisome biosynthesis protein pex1, partial [Ceratobasidium sp. 395]
MPRLFSIKYTPLRTCLVNLPMSLYGPLAAKQVLKKPRIHSAKRPQRLAVHVSLPGSSEGTYLGWTGMASASSLSKWQHGAQAAAEALDTIEIDPQVAQSYGFKDGVTVEIGLVHNLPIATNVETVPLSSDDWEILETHAEYVEQNLLSQVRAVAVGQEISVWAMGRSRVQFQVVSTKPEGQAVLLGPDTEVAIAPKLRAPPQALKPQAQKDAENKSQATNIQNKSSTPPSANDPLPLALRVLPARLASTFVGVGSSELEVYVASQDLQKLSSQNPDSPCTHAWLVRVRPPRPVREFDKRGKPVEKANPAPVVLQQNKKEEKGPEDGQTHVPGVLVRVKAHEDVPVGHAVVVGLESKIQEWDTILLTYSENPAEASRSSSPGQTAPTEVHTQKTATDADGSELAGVDSILADCHDFFVRTYMQPDAFGTAGGSHLPGLLLHGAPGSGKTSVARSVVKKLEADPRIHACIVYVDLAQMADEHTSALRSKFKTWKAVAAWRQPSVLVLDNLDKVVSAEVERLIYIVSKQHTDSARARHLAEHFLDVFAASPAQGVAILASCASPSALHPLLASSHVFSCKVQLRAPDKAARRD